MKVTFLTLLARALMAWTVGRSVAAAPSLIRQTMKDSAAVFVLMGIGLFLLVLILLCGLWWGYLELLLLGMTAQTAVLALAGFLLALLGVVMFSLDRKVKAMRRTAEEARALRFPLPPEVTKIFDAFKRGYEKKK